MTSSRPNVLLLSCYELGHQPLGLATPLGFFERAGLPARGIDLSVDALDEAAVRGSDFIGVSVPMHTALRIGLRLAERIRKINPGCFLCFYGLYATLNADYLLSTGADAVLSGECEESLVTLARKAVSRARPTSGRRERPAPVLERLDFPAPNRGGLPGLNRYVQLERPDGTRVSVGTVETSRGCLHHCRHCPIPPIYEGRFFVVPRETVLEDVRKLVSLGAHHIDFADPDFLNGPGHALAVTRAMHAEFPELTFNFTAKVEHLLKHRRHLPELAELGCAFIVSAVESLSDRVLEELDKGHSRADVLEVLSSVREAGIAFRPTFVAFTPWTTREDYLELLRFVAERKLVSSVDPVQLALRLLIPPGSLLLENESLKPYLGPLHPSALTYRWRHPDPAMDRLQQRAEGLVEAGVRETRENGDLFASLVELASRELEVAPMPSLESVSAGSPAPRLTENWFC